MSNILIIGNGFDLYHGLPTRYSDLLFLAENWNKFYKNYMPVTSSEENVDQFTVRLNNGKLSRESLIDFCNHKTTFNDEHIQFLNEHLTSNHWIKYFLKFGFQGKGWVDFEAEIDDALHKIDIFFSTVSKYLNDFSQSYYEKEFFEKIQYFLLLTKDKYTDFKNVHENDVQSSMLREHKNYLISKLENELNVLNECLRLYLLEFVLKIKCDKYSKQVESLHFNYLLNFNYTYTYRTIYGVKDTEHHPIHGDCINDNMILGIPDESFKRNLEFIHFAKYFQRISKKSGNFYKEWIKRPDSLTCSDVPCDVYIMGHSLSVNDKGILKDFFLNDWVRKITIFYHNQQAMDDLIVNLVYMFGQDYVIEQTGNNRIVFEKLNQAIDKKYETI